MSDTEKVDDIGIRVGDKSTSVFQPSTCDTVSRTASRLGTESMREGSPQADRAMPLDRRR